MQETDKEEKHHYVTVGKDYPVGVLGKLPVLEDFSQTLRWSSCDLYYVKLRHQVLERTGEA